MHDQSYLMFQLNQARYGIPAAAVQEIFFLPEVTVIADVPDGCLGVMNLRGELLSVMDLHDRFGQSRPPLRLSDSLIVLEWQTQRVGIVVSQVDSVQAIAADHITASLSRQAEASVQAGFILGIANIEEGIVTLLNPEGLVQQVSGQIANPDAKAAAQNGAAHSATNGAIKGARNDASNPALNQALYEHFDAQARQILHERTEALRYPIDNQDSAGLMPLAVVGLGGEFFGFELETVYEFTEIHKITPIPCCPSHIVGNINLRGEIITLINIHDVVDLPINAVRSQPQAVVVRLDQRVAGIAVDNIFDVTYIHPSQVSPPPLTMRTDKDDFLQGIAPYQNRMMSIINLSELLTSEVLIVNEEV